ncbi:LON peptidase substrate-binding domain-containing protein [Rhabdaerophilum sp. SD176]|uniref:LON peptidase substrate-binding domain-containing protein n=1 Tax=Rhabdaerophilum sp. SD176 TaxID=2983548 RepID=UPI0024DFA868|nr:LON peptidase substrate-binding domain-containing protein [Rhabdaerophilum sp. SD176]
MASNVAYLDAGELPGTLPVFPLPGALLLPRGQMPLNIFEPRYLAMIDAALRADRLIGMIQPDASQAAQIGLPSLYQVGCAGRITQFAETGDGRYLVQLTGICRFRLVEEIPADTLFRQVRADFRAFEADLEARRGEERVRRQAVIDALRRFSEANRLEIDWDNIHAAPNEALVNALSMMAPFGVAEKQALLEAPDLESRADMLVALTEMDLVRDAGDGGTRMQ